MKKNKMIELIKYELGKSITTKWFIIFNILMLIIGIVSINFSEIKKYTDIFSNHIKIEVLDEQNIIYADLESQFSKEEFSDKVRIKKVDAFTHTEDNIEDHFLLLEVKQTSEDVLNIKLISLKEIDSQYLNIIKDVVTKKKNELLSEELDISKENIELLMKEIEIEERIVRYRYK